MYVMRMKIHLLLKFILNSSSWEARYAGADNGQLGRGNVNFIKGINTMGVDMSDDAFAQDDKQVTELHLPKGRKVYSNSVLKMYYTLPTCLTLEHK